MSARFEGLRERLLRGGIAPRHVRRYLRELEEHYADLYAAQREAGFEPEDAGIRARARLGEDAELAQAMIDQRDFRSITARFPWLIFPLLPLPAVLAGLAVPVLLMIGLVKLYGFWIGASLFVVPDWLRLLSETLLATANFIMMPLIMLLLTVLVWRQRLSLLWLLPGLFLLLPFITDAGTDFPAAGKLLETHNSFHVGIGWNWGWWSSAVLPKAFFDVLPGRLGSEIQAGIYSGLVRQLLMLLPFLVVMTLRFRNWRKSGAHAV